VARDIAQQIRLKLTPAEQARLASARAVVPEAHEAYLRGRYHATKFTREPLLKARDYLQQAIDKDPTYAPAYAELSHVDMKLSQTSPAPADLLSQARAAARKAMELDPSLGQAHTVAGLVSIFADWDPRTGAKELERGLELAPDSADALIHASFGRLFMGRRQESKAAVEHALELEPLNLEISVLAGQFFLGFGDYHRAIDQLQKTLEIDPNFARAYWALTHAYAAQGMWPEAARAYQQWMLLTGRTQQQVEAFSKAFEQQGSRGYWMWQLQELEKSAQQGFDFPTERAGIYAVLGDKENAFACLEKAYREHDFNLFTIAFGYRFASLRSDPRFADLLRRTGLSP
jgi:tetratricopeptide (TPR) repeat protein